MNGRSLKSFVNSSNNFAQKCLTNVTQINQNVHNRLISQVNLQWYVIVLYIVQSK